MELCLLLAALLAAAGSLWRCKGFPFSPFEAKKPSRSFVRVPHERVTPFTTALWLTKTDSSARDGRDSNGGIRKNMSNPNKKSKKQQDYERRRQEWLDRYGSLEALQSTFGSNSTASATTALSPQQTRRLYHSLLPRSLLALYEMGLMQPEELAPLAYEARMAAKQYARSRCVWYARVATELFDYYRSMKRSRNGLLSSLLGLLRTRRSSSPGDNKTKSSSMTWDEIWSKYEAQIVQEECEALLQKYNSTDDREKVQKKTEKKLKSFQQGDDKDLTMSIYLRILERSCVTNQAFDQMFLGNSSLNDKSDDVLPQMARQLDQDVREILLRPKDREKADKLERKRIKAQEETQRKQEKQLQKEQKRRDKAEHKIREKEAKLREEAGETEFLPTIAAVIMQNASSNITSRSSTTTSGITATDWQVLRILAGTRRKFRCLRSSKNENNG